MVVRRVVRRVAGRQRGRAAGWQGTGSMRKANQGGRGSMPIRPRATRANKGGQARPRARRTSEGSCFLVDSNEAAQAAVFICVL